MGELRLRPPVNAKRKPSLLEKAGAVINTKIDEAIAFARENKMEPYALAMGMRQFFLLQHYAAMNKGIFSKNARQQVYVRGYPVVIMNLDMAPVAIPDPVESMNSMLNVIERQQDQNGGQVC